MGTLYWEGKADAVAQVSTGSIDTVDGTPANNTFTVTIGGVAVSATGDTDVSTTATALRAALNASTHPYFAAVTWSGSSGDITGTADTAGVPFVAALTVSGAGTGSVTDFSDTTASAGPNHWDTADNWDTGAVPVASDVVYIRDSSVNICWGLAQSAVDLNELHIEKTYTGKIGLDYRSFATSADGDTLDTSKAEYRDTYLAIESDAVELGYHAGPGNPNGSQRIKLDLNVHAATVTVHDTARSPSETGKPVVRLKANSSSTDVFVRGAPGGVGIAAGLPGETSTVRKVSVSDDGGDTRVHVGDGVTVTTYEQKGGQNVLRAGTATVTTVDVQGGNLTLEGDQVVTTLKIEGGTVVSNVTGTIGTVTHDGGTLDLTESNQARTITTHNLKYVGGSPVGTVLADPDVITWTNGIAPTS